VCNQVAVVTIETGGADFVVMATNTMHRVAPQLVDELSIPFLHIVDTAVDAIRADGVETVGVLGTKAVMEGRSTTSGSARAESKRSCPVSTTAKSSTGSSSRN